MLSANRTKFLKGEGLQLMRLILREQKHARNSALKVIILEKKFYFLNYNSNKIKTGAELCYE